MGNRLVGEKTTPSALDDGLLKQGGWMDRSEGYELP